MRLTFAISRQAGLKQSNSVRQGITFGIGNSRTDQESCGIDQQSQDINHFDFDALINRMCKQHATTMLYFLISSHFLDSLLKISIFEIR